MKVKNVSARLHHIGDVSIAPGQTAEIPEAFRNSINKTELVEVKPVAPTAPPAPGSKAAAKAAAIAKAEAELAAANESGDKDAIAAAQKLLDAAKA